MPIHPSASKEAHQNFADEAAAAHRKAAEAFIKYAERK